MQRTTDDSKTFLNWSHGLTTDYRSHGPLRSSLPPDQKMRHQLMHFSFRLSIAEKSLASDLVHNINNVDYIYNLWLFKCKILHFDANIGCTGNTQKKDIFWLEIVPGKFPGDAHGQRL